MTNDQQVVKTEELPIDVLKNQYPAITNEIIKTVNELSKVDPKWPTAILIMSGVALLVLALLMRAAGGLLAVNVTATEFITMVITAAVLMLAGPLFNMYLSRNWRKIILDQQALGVQILHKEIDIARESHNRRNRQQLGEVMIFHTKIRKSFRH
jgi:hypothetical protein